MSRARSPAPLAESLPAATLPLHTPAPAPLAATEAALIIHYLLGTLKIQTDPNRLRTKSTYKCRSLENACLSVSIQWVSVTPSGDCTCFFSRAFFCGSAAKQEAKCNVPVSLQVAFKFFLAVVSLRYFHLFSLLVGHFVNHPSGKWLAESCVYTTQVNQSYGLASRKHAVVVRGKDWVHVTIQRLNASDNQRRGKAVISQ